METRGTTKGLGLLCELNSSCECTFMEGGDAGNFIVEII